MIKKLNNFTNKSFSNYTGPDDEFRNINVIFGYNGTGKTALMEGLEDEFLKENDKNNLRVFSLDYMHKHLILDDSNGEKLKGVKATFGETDVNIEKEIKKLEGEIVSEVEIEKKTKEKEDLEEKTKKEIDKIFGAKKGTLNIQGKPKSLPIIETIERYKKDYENALKVEPNVDNIKNAIGDDSIENKISNIKLLNIPSRIIFSQAFYDEIDKYQNKKFVDIEIPNSTVIKWLTEGIEIHEHKLNCEFCDSKIDYKRIQDKVNSFSSNIKYKAEVFYGKQAKILLDIIKEFETFIKTKLSFSNLLGDSINSHFEFIDEKINFLEKTYEIFNNNSKNITSLVKVDLQELQKHIEMINNIIDEINKIKSEILTSEKSKLDKIGIIVKGSVYLEIEGSSFISNNVITIDSLNDFIVKSNETNEELSRKIKELKSLKSVSADFMELVNETLKGLGISIILEIEDDDYILKTTLLGEKQLTVDEISEGEKNLLSLLFFYFEMFEDKNQETVKKEIKLIILDDPISSMDDSNRFYVLEIVESLIGLDVEQVFVLTHVWDDFSQLIFRKKSFEENSEYASYEIKKDKCSYLIKNISKGSPYKHMFKEVYDLSKQKDLENDCDYYHMPNIIRKVFEEFLFFKTHQNLPQKGNKKHIENIFKIKSLKDKQDLGTLISVINVLSHTNTKTNSDILIAAKFLMKIIKNNDNLHYNRMKE